MQEKQILITGSKGLIGTALKKQLEKSGYRVKSFDIRYPNDHPSFGDIRDLSSLKKIITNCVGVIHLAAVSRVISGEKEPELCWDTNVNGTRNVLEIAQAMAIKPWVIYASSREVYGQQPILPVKETAPLIPMNIYARTKVMAETHLQDYRSQGLQTAIVRFSNVYGSIDDHADRVIPAFCRIAAFGGTLRIEGKHNTFDFTYIDDVIEGLLKIITKLEEGYLELPTIHLTTGKATTLLEAANLASKISKYEVNFEEAPSRSFDVSSFFGDPNLAFEVLNWKSTVNIEEGIGRLVNALRIQSKLAMAS